MYSKIKCIGILVLLFITASCPQTPEMTDEEIVQADVDELAITYSGSDTAASVTLNLTLPTTGTNGSTISWLSSNAAVISNTGTVTRPVYGSGNASVTMTATITYGSSSQNVIFTLTVLELPYTGLTDTERVQADSVALSITYSGTDTINNVTLNLGLPTSGSNGSAIAWVSDNGSVITNGGIVTRPPLGSGNAVVTLTATVSYGTATPQDVIFTLTVIETPLSGSTDAEIVQADFNLLTITYSGSDTVNTVTLDIILASSGTYGSTITWTSNDTVTITNVGVVTRPSNGSGNAPVTMTAHVAYGAASQDKLFYLTVLELPAVPVTDEEIVQSDVYALAIGYSGSDSASSVTLNLTLPASGTSGSTITWSSDNTTAISNAGVVTRPTYPNGNVTVTLTATVSYGTATPQNVIFTLTVIENLPPAGYITAYTVGGVTFNLLYTPAKTTFTGTGDGSQATIANGFNFSETEITYELWSTVYTWATTDAGGGLRADGGTLYAFQNTGKQGGDLGACASAVGTNQHPVACINWRDAMVWTNALTEYVNATYSLSLSPAYYSDGDSSYLTPHRDSTNTTCGVSVTTTAGACDNPDVMQTAKGFRLPTNNEFELAARYISDGNSDGDIMDAGEYYPGNFASGADAIFSATTGASDYDGDTDVDYTNNVSINSGNSGGTTGPVKSKSVNKLGLYDMSGNVSEWIFDWHPSYINTQRILKGGSWFDGSSSMQTGIQLFAAPQTSPQPNIGFRVLRNQ